MGLCWSRRMNAEDREQEKIAEFVRYAITSDLVHLQAMITKQKMDPNAKDRFGMNAVHWGKKLTRQYSQRYDAELRLLSTASYVGELGCIQELIKAGGLPSAVDSNGRNALHHACRKDHDEVVRYLVTTAKVNINSRSENQDTPLHKAVRGKSIKVLEMLLKLGADPNLRNEQGRTPLEELELLVEDAKPVPTVRLTLHLIVVHVDLTEVSKL
ncbi:Ankyrin-3 [Phytophthora citrophthora]|uniref:Ankyrin-3 n=1 Tax=Phytophthora citrophthora TaxID=4793 RepID=A0AAD9GW52_9STRA|nr:Ankyrin-3 [Phytophthora citrophthora]